MEQHEESPSNENASYKRVPKPEEQALVDELAILSAQYGDQFPHICHFVQKGKLKMMTNINKNLLLLLYR